MSETVPEGWECKKLGEVATLIMGQSPTSDTYNDNKHGVPFFQGKADFGVKYPKVRYWCTSPTKIAPMDSILFSVRAPVGAVNLNNVEACIGRGLASISGQSIDNTFLYQSLIYAKVKFEALGQGSTFEAINGNELKEFPVVCPPLPEQKKIASILTSVDEVIENTQKQIDKLQDLKKATMNELLTKGIGHTEFKDSELGRIPKSWVVVELGDVSNVTKLAGFEYTEHFDYSIGGEIIALRALNLDGGNLDLTDIQTIPKSISDSLPRSKLFYGDILISYVGSVGELGFIYDNDRFHLAPNVAKISCDLNKVNAQFILQQLLSDRAQKNIKDLTTITSQPSLNMANIRKIRLLVCPINEQDKIVQVLSSLDTKSDYLEQKLFQTQSLKKSLMQDLLTGKVRVQVN